MEIEWFVTAQIRISEKAYKYWLTKNINFNFEVTYINPMEAEPDPIIGDVTSFAKEKPKISISKFFAQQLIWQIQNSPNSIFYFIYDAEKQTLDFIMGIQPISDKQTAQILAAIFSIVEYKNISSCDMCLLSRDGFENVLYLNEIYQKNVMVMPKITREYFIPENISKIYKIACETNLSVQEKLASIEPSIIEEFHKIIDKELAPGIEEILKKSSEEAPSIITDNSLFKTDGKNVLGTDGSVIKEADPHSFKSIGGYYAADTNNVYYDSEKIEEADPKTFSVLDWDYAKDKNNAYFIGQKICDLNNGNFKAIKPAYGYAASDKSIFYCGNCLEGSDPESFHVIGEGRQKDSIYFGVDKNQVYLEGKIISYIDPATFQHIGKQFFKDKNHIYVNAKVVEGCSPLSMRALNTHYIADDKDAYCIYEDSVIPLHVKDMKNLIVNDFFATDKINVYYQGIKIKDADGATANIFDENNDGYFTDKKNVFYCDEKITANIATFHTLGFGYAADDTNVFFRDAIVENADPKTFKPTGYGSGNDKFGKYSFSKQITTKNKKIIKRIVGNYFKDDKNIYYKRVIIKNADYKSFSPISMDKDSKIIATNGKNTAKDDGIFYAKDKNDVYYMGIRVIDAEPASFHIINVDDFNDINWENRSKYVYGADSKKVYYRGKELATVSPKEFYPYQIDNVWISGTKLYHKGKPLNYIDFESFKHIEYVFYTDTSTVYYETEPIDGLMPDNIMVISPRYIHDDIFFCYVEKKSDGSIIKNLFEADVNSFDIIEFNMAFSYDKFGLFFRGKRLKDVDISSISYLDDNYLKDSKGIFCGNIRLQGIDADSFTPLGSGYASDGKTSFYQALRLETSKPIHVLGSGYAMDGENFWLNGEELKNPQKDPFIQETLGFMF